MAPPVRCMYTIAGDQLGPADRATETEIVQGDVLIGDVTGIHSVLKFDHSAIG